MHKAVLAGRDSLVLGQACQSLVSAVDTCSARVQPLAPLVSQVQSVYPDDKFLQTVLGSVPHEALECGVQSNFTLRRRFPRVKKACGRVALLGEKGGGLGIYVLSYFQSMLMWHKQSLSPQVDDVLIETADFSVYDILNAAERQLELGHMDNTVRLLNQLRGQPRLLAEDWIQQAQLLLETQQAVRLLNAYSNLLAIHGNAAKKPDVQADRC